MSKAVGAGPCGSRSGPSRRLSTGEISAASTQHIEPANRARRPHPAGAARRGRGRASSFDIENREGKDTDEHTGLERPQDGRRQGVRIVAPRFAGLPQIPCLLPRTVPERQRDAVGSKVNRISDPTSGRLFDADRGQRPERERFAGLREHVVRRFRVIDRQVSELADLEVEVFEERNPAISDSQVAEATLHLKGVHAACPRRVTGADAFGEHRLRRARGPGQASPRQAAQTAGGAQRGSTARARIHGVPGTR